MIIASMIVRTLPDKVDETILELQKLPYVTTHGVHKDDNIIVLVEAESEEKLKDLGRYINSEFEHVLGTYPTFISADEDLTEETKSN